MKIYFASDVHLGAPTIEDHRTHEQNFIKWLDTIKKDADELYILGDIFDYWYEYKTVVPKGFVRFLGKICELTDNGIKVHFFTGNHDVWMRDYLPKECGVIVHSKECVTTIDGKEYVIGHGDGVGGYDKAYSLLKWIFNWKVAQFCYTLIHPDIGSLIASNWSRSSRKSDNKNTKFHSFLGEEEHQVKYARTRLKENSDIKYFIFGHRHIAVDYTLGSDSRLIILGDWMKNMTYAVSENGQVNLYRWTTGETIKTN